MTTERAAALIEAASSVVMACHVGPDGDALGSMLGLAHAAASRNKTVYPSFGEPFVVGATYSFLPIELLVPPSEVPAEPDLMISFDAGSIDRLGDLEPNASRARNLIVIDHHVTNTGFGEINLIDPGASSTAEMVYELMGVLGWPIDQVTATCLHTGVVTDTGRFQYSNTSPRTLEVAARLVEAGARPEMVGQKVYEEVPFGYLHLAGAVLARARLDAGRRFVWSSLTQEDLDEAGIGMDDIDPLIDAVRVARESDVAALVKVVENGRVKVSLRSRGRVDVGAIALELGGGGHHNASGFTISGSIEDAVEAVTARLEIVE
ncbi:MAG: bifunctional oligoribonuclease/PAP phosphatase NrnA [Acidimicrobiia bacterium]|nr:bifunctional oligoribonuclease/PAP phosphatase NrnA [Acidimicrobiia bacterium]MDH4306819.1 bifunctional oligoribonuclease/PAP phosphatase NrnA [Acidimicrobiia bacterium]